VAHAVAWYEDSLHFKWWTDIKQLFSTPTDLPIKLLLPI
jgi:hypothetical protein